MTRVLVSLWMLMAALPAEAGWFDKDEYDPPSPGFGTLVLHRTAMLGMHYTHDALPDRTARVAFSGNYDVGVLVLPFLAPSLRGGIALQGARAPIPDSEDAYAGFRTLTAYVDGCLNVESKWGRVYAFRSVVDRTRTLGLFGSGWPGAPTNYMHFGGGIELRGGWAIGRGEDNPTGATMAVLVEYRRSRWELDEPVSFAPSNGWGDTIYVSVGGFVVQPKKKKEEAK